MNEKPAHLTLFHVWQNKSGQGDFKNRFSMTGAGHGTNEVVCVSSTAWFTRETQKKMNETQIWENMCQRPCWSLWDQAVAPIMGESPTLPTILFLIPPVEVAQATLPAESTATAPTVSCALWGGERKIQSAHKILGYFWPPLSPLCHAVKAVSLHVQN